MSTLTLNEQASTPSTPAATKVKLYVDNTATPRLKMIDDAGSIVSALDSKHDLIAKGDLITASAANTPTTLSIGSDGQILAASSTAASGLKWVAPVMTNSSTANQTGFAVDTYLSGSSIAVPAGLVRVGTIYRLRFDMVKTAAGAATPILSIRFGTTGTVADTARLTFTWAVGTAAIDTGLVEVWAHLRTVGAGTSAVLVGIGKIEHALAATGLTTTGAAGSAQLMVTSGGFDSTVVNSIIGASFNGGALFAGTNVLVQAEAYNLNV